MNAGLRLLLVVALLGGTAAVLAAEPESYVCNGKQAVGFAMNKHTHRWSVSVFNPRQYVIRVPKRGPDQPSGAQTAVLAVYQVGGNASDPAGPLFCDQGFNDAGFLRCEGLGESFMFNRKTHRFVHWLPYGYIDPPGAFFDGATPYIEIGTCAPI